ncbi:MAG TPA: hypothetical protein PKY13_04050 [Microthrixaceae bacterium]|nr:hypothetical protein [Microthrixaceae bacterium]
MNTEPFGDLDDGQVLVGAESNDLVGRHVEPWPTGFPDGDARLDETCPDNTRVDADLFGDFGYRKLLVYVETHRLGDVDRRPRSAARVLRRPHFDACAAQVRCDCRSLDAESFADLGERELLVDVESFQLVDIEVEPVGFTT